MIRQARFRALFEQIEITWKGQNSRRVVSSVLVASFLLSLLVIELKRRGVLPASLESSVPANHFYAVNLVFTLLLVYEVIGLVFSLVHSVANSVGKQIEILSLILLRQSFEELVHFTEPIEWLNISEPVLRILSDAAGALIIFFLLGIFYRMQKHRAITARGEEQDRFVAAKMLIALLIILVFVAFGLFTLVGRGLAFDVHYFFGVFYTVLIFSDILIVIISLRYSSNYYTLFRNSGFAVTTMVIRLALTAPAFGNVALGIAAVLFAIGLTYTYNRYWVTE